MWTSYTMSYETTISGDTMFAPDPPVQLTSGMGDGPVSLEGSRTDLTLTHHVIDGRNCVVITVIV